MEIPSILFDHCPLAIVFESSIILAVNSFNFPSILTKRYMDITIGNPRFAMPVNISSMISPPKKGPFGP